MSCKIDDQESKNIDPDNYSEDNEINESCSEDDNNDQNEDAPDISEIGLTKKEIMYYRVIDKYYKSLDKKNIESMIQIVDGKSKISLRLLDWFVTRYADKYKIRFNKKVIVENGENSDNKVDDGFNVHISYKCQLKSYKKRYFDPFRRRKKFKYYFDKEKTTSMVTTIGQLHFFRWAFVNGIIDYVNINYVAISKAMVNTNKIDKNRKLKEKNEKNKIEKESDKSEGTNDNVEEISVKKNGVNITAKKNIKHDEVKIVLSFD
ncbi:hypothetical protein QKU48_gp0589 [Fadolivirus algeromassiliense]|jgi:hypothetical protein|uniref:Uncharacterized protein n=1 Tax=Fadolivirus FV1/VV64 TaxID=3070911 RepID=A0A7D3QUD2_9VIRU|nr:hypothetical protein QKU48_gp0589 [Fadolivirus algeromassiliense]QKF94047.1 hypothetical protein Fadolivirus_1_589 [Fadolivirus FV1/VV64]